MRDYDAVTGELTLTSAGSTASLAQWQAALRSITYSNSSDAPGAASRTISFTANDGADDSAAATRSVSVAAVNDAPVVAVPASITVTEDAASALTGISFADPDAGTSNVTVTLSVASGTLSAASGSEVTVGGTGSALTMTGTVANINAFIVGSNLTYTTAANATADVTMTVAIDDGGNTGSGGAQQDSDTVTLKVTTVNDSPVATTPISISVAEDVATELTGISFADVDAGSGAVTVTFSVGSGTLSAVSSSGVTVTGAGTGSLTLSGSIADINVFIAAGAVSFTTVANTTSDVVLTVSIDDGGNSGDDPGNSGTGDSEADSTTVTLSVTAVNDAPINSVPGAQTVDEDGALVFSSGNGNAIAISDVDAGGGTVRVTLTGSNGLITLGSTTGLSFIVGSGTNDGVMTFEGTLADINVALQGMTFTPATGFTGAASIEIVSSDLGLSGTGGNQTDTDTIAITVLPDNPQVTGVDVSNPDGSYRVGDIITIQVSFDQAVDVDTSGGTPTLLLETGLNDRNAVYLSGSGSDTLTFSYTVQAGDLSADLDFHSTGTMALNGATIRGSSSADAVLTLPATGGAGSIAGQADIVIDGVAATVSSVSVPVNGTYTAGQNLDLTVHLSEAVIVGGTPRIAITLDSGGTVYADYVSGSGTTALIFRLTVAAGQLDTTGIAIGAAIEANGGTLQDAVGNDTTLALNNVAPTGNVLVDAQPPTATITLSDTVLGAGETALVTFTFSEAVSGLTLADISAGNGTLSGLSSTDGGVTWTAVLTPAPGTVADSNAIALNLGGVADGIGQSGAGIALSPNYAVATMVPAPPPGPPATPPAPTVFTPSDPPPTSITVQTVTSFGPPVPPLTTLVGASAGFTFGSEAQGWAMPQMEFESRVMTMSIPTGVALQPGEAFSIGIVRDADDLGNLTFELQSADGVELPDWVQFDPASGTISGQVPEGFSGAVRVQIIITDDEGRTVVRVMELSAGDGTASGDQASLVVRLPAEASGRQDLDDLLALQAGTGSAQTAALLRGLAAVAGRQG